MNRRMRTFRIVLSAAFMLKTVNFRGEHMRKESFGENHIELCGGYECPVPKKLYDIIPFLESRYKLKSRQAISDEAKYIKMLDRETSVFWTDKATDYKTGKSIYRFGYYGNSKTDGDRNSTHIENEVICKESRIVNKIYRNLKNFYRINRYKYGFSLPAEKLCTREEVERISADLGTVAVIDLEMSWQFPIQFAGILLKFEGDKLEIISEESFYIQSEASKKISRKVMELTGLTPEFIEKHGIKIAEAEKRMSRFFSDVKTICGQSVINDIKSLKKFFNYSRNEMPKILINPNIIDTLILYRYLFDGAARIDLETMVHKFGIDADTEKIHDALGDTRLTLEILRKAEPIFISRFGESSVRSPEYFLAPEGKDIINEILPRNYRKFIANNAEMQEEQKS